MKKIKLNEEFLMIIKITMRHSFVSLFAGLVEFLLFLIFINNMKCSFIVSYTLSFAISTIVAFFGHGFLTFRLNRLLLKNLIFFLIQVIIVFLIGYSAMSFFVNIGMELNLSKLLQLATTFLFSLLFGKFVSFKSRDYVL